MRLVHQSLANWSNFVFQVVSSALAHIVQRGKHPERLKNVCGTFDAVSPGNLLFAVGALLEDIFADTCSKKYRTVSALDQSVKHSSDMLVSLRGSQNEFAGGSKSSLASGTVDGVLIFGFVLACMHAKLVDVNTNKYARIYRFEGNR